jgi:hypothetical protein
MYKEFFLIVIIIIYIGTTSNAQTRTNVYSTKFIPESVTYNGSDDPNECWESVDYGIIIKVENSSLFFNMEYRDLEILKEKIGDTEVQVEVIYYDEPTSGSYSVGKVVKVSLNEEIIFE